MAFFKHHPDGYIILGNVQLPLVQFMFDEPDYLLPAGAVGQEYQTGVRHYAHDARGNAHSLIEGDSVLWQAGEVYYAKRDEYLANYAERFRSKVTITSDISEIHADLLPLEVLTATITIEGGYSGDVSIALVDPDDGHYFASIPASAGIATLSITSQKLGIHTLTAQVEGMGSAVLTFEGI